MLSIAFCAEVSIRELGIVEKFGGSGLDIAKRTRFIGNGSAKQVRFDFISLEPLMYKTVCVLAARAYIRIIIC